MTKTQRSASIAFATALLVAVGACRQKEGTHSEMSMAAAAPTPSVVSVVARDFAFEAPAEIPAGLTTIKLMNQGAEFHHAQLVKFAEGKALADLLALPPDAPHPEWVSFAGGPNAVSPGGEANATSVLEPGHYALIDVIPGADGVPHIAKGMSLAIEVTGTASPATAEPSADVVMTLVDYGFQTSAAITAGTHTIRVENAGPQIHEVVVAKIASGKTSEDFMAWLQTMAGEPPGTVIGGVVNLDVGKHAYFTATFEPGDYLLLCFVPDARDGQLHVAHGMVRLIHVS
jgi:hypothetical protein